VNPEQERALSELAARRWRLAIILTGAMLLVYFGFILLVAFDRPLMGTLLADGRISVGIVLGALVIVTAPVLTTIYVRWANQHYDGEITALRHALAAEGLASAAASSSRAPSIHPDLSAEPRPLPPAPALSPLREEAQP
jgi:uncharacterized membrane protein (DUF485 family)